MPDNTADTEDLQRLKILYVYDILTRFTDQDHILSVEEISARLAEKGIEAGRKALYADIRALQAYGLDVLMERQGRHIGYHVVSREFEVPELRLLADSVSASQFITQKKTRTLINKLTGLCSTFEAQSVTRSLKLMRSSKTGNERIYLNIDRIQQAAQAGVQVSFRYFDRNIRREKVYRQGLRYCTPYQLVWNNGRYYLVGCYEKRPDQLTNFRGDRMEAVELTDRAARPMPEGLDLSRYLSESFDMFSADSQRVVLRFRNTPEMVGVVMDRFGDAAMIPDGEEHFTVHLQVRPQKGFYAWLFQLGDQAEVVSPAEVREEYKDQLEKALAMLAK